MKMKRKGRKKATRKKTKKGEVDEGMEEEKRRSFH